MKMPVTVSPGGRTTARRRERLVTRSYAVEAARYTGTYPGRADQVQRARKDVARHLAAHPATADAILITSELASNAILHSRSKNESFTVRAEIFPGYLRLEVEDLGGPWNPKPRDPDRPHGLDVIQTLTGPGNWGVDQTGTSRVVWCRLDLETQR
jgi:anti-sigma regulatory factor (Ser/Thr protein kinase)